MIKKFWYCICLAFTELNQTACYLSGGHSFEKYFNVCKFCDAKRPDRVPPNCYSEFQAMSESSRAENSCEDCPFIKGCKHK